MDRINTFHDDRGQVRRCLSGASLFEVLSTGNVRERLNARIRDSARNICRARKTRTRLAEWFIWTAIPAATAVLFLNLVMFSERWKPLRRSMGLSEFEREVGPFIVLAISVLIILVALLRRRLGPKPDSPGVIARMLAAEGFCPSCGYALSGLRREADGCSVCPECGCAIRIETAPS